MKTHTRLTKAAVLAEVNTLRGNIRTWTDMTHVELGEEYRKTFPASEAVVESLSREKLMQGLLMAATYYMTNVLNLE